MKIIAIVMAIGIILGSILPVTATHVAAASDSSGFASDKIVKKDNKLKEAKETTLQLLELKKRYEHASKAEKIASSEAFIGLAKQREQLLVSLIKDKEANSAEAFLKVALSEDLRREFPKELHKHLEQEVTIDGLLTVLHSDDFETGKSEHLYFLSDKTNGEKLEVHFADNNTAHIMHSNAEVEVHGIMIANQQLVVPEETESMKVLDSAPQQMAAGAAATNTKKVAVILYNFQNNNEEFSKEHFREVTFTGQESVNAYYQESSFGKIALQGHFRPDGDIFGWYTVPYSEYCQEGNAAASNAAKQMAQVDGFNMNNYDNVIYGFPLYVSCPNHFVGWAFIGGKESWINGFGNYDLGVVAHELGHNFGLAHASSYDCVDNNNNALRVPISNTCSRSEYGDPFDVMGSAPSGVHHMSTYHKGKLNFYDAGNTRDVTASGTYSVTPIEQSSTGVQALRIPTDFSTSWLFGSPLYYYVEYRKSLGFDNFWPDDPVVNGISIRLAPAYPPSFSGSTQTLLLDGTPMTTTYADSAIRVGSTISDPISGLTVKTIGLTPDMATVNVYFGLGACLRGQPELSISPTAQWGSPGESLTYDLRMINHDSAECPDSTFSVSHSLPSAPGWSQSPFSPSITLSPGSIGTISVSITSSQDSVQGFYTLYETVFNIDEPVYSDTASAGYNVEGDATIPSIAAPADITLTTTGTRMNLCQDIPVPSIFSIGDDGAGHVATNTLDNNIGTRWSHEGVGSWIRPDLGSTKVICSVDISWYNGHQRVYNFVVSVSNDGVNFKDVFTGRSSGVTQSPEKYQFDDSVGRYVMITVNANNVNTFASITEIDVHGYTALGLPVFSDNLDPFPLVKNSVPSNGLPIGSSTVTWTATDAKGNTNSDSQLVKVIAGDTTLPTLSITSPATGSTITGPSNAVKVSLKGTATDAGTGIQKVELKSLKSGVAVHGYQQATPGAQGNWGTWSHTLTFTQTGTYTITARATDNAGNQNWYSVNINIAFASADTTSPTVSITSPQNGASFSGPSSLPKKISLAGIAADSGSGVQKVELKSLKGGIVVHAYQLAGTSNNWANWARTLSFTESGTYTITARVTDVAGNQNWHSITVNISLN